jgi:asparaginyl-tRNA synthetase
MFLVEVFMFNRTEIKTLFMSPVGGEYTVCGWIRTLRKSKGLCFIALNDGSTAENLQIVAEEAKLSDFNTLSAQGTGAGLSVSGSLILTPGARQPFELNITDFTVLGVCPADYPLQKKNHTPEFLRTIPHLRARSNTFGNVFRVRSEAAFALHEFFHKSGFYYVNTPIITDSDCEGAGEMFTVTTLEPGKAKITQNTGLTVIPCENDEKTSDTINMISETLNEKTSDTIINSTSDTVSKKTSVNITDNNSDKSRVNTSDYDIFEDDFFGKHAALTVSGQLEGEYMALSLGKIYTFGPTFRAEQSYTPRHAAEFWMIEPEMAFADLSDDMNTAEAMLKFVLERILNNCPNEMSFFDKFYENGLTDRLKAVINSDFARCSYTEAIKLLSDSGQAFDYPVSWGMDLQTEHERYLSEVIFRKPVFVYDYPRDIKAFYMRQNDDGKTVSAVDLLVPRVGELIGGSAREERLDKLTERMSELNMETSDYNRYLDTRRFGSVPHAGFGLGFERLLMYVTGIQNIRDVIPFPRTAGSIY